MSQALTLFAPRESGLHRLHPLTKLALTGFCLVSGIALPGAWTTYLPFIFIVLPLAVWGRISGQLLGRAWRIVLPFAVSVTLIQGLFWHAGTPVLFLGPLSLKREGLLFAATSTGRILSVVGSFLLLAMSTRPDALMISLSQRGLPASITYIVLATIQIAPNFQARAQAILEAQQSRGLETQGNLARRARSVLPLVTPLVLGSILDIEERAIALEARGFNKQGPKTSLVVLRDTTPQRAARGLLLAGMAGAVVLRAAVYL